MNTFSRSSTIQILADATPQTGLGHFMRSLGLARELQHMGSPCRIIGQHGPFAHEIANSLDIELVESSQLIEQRAGQLKDDSRVVIDSYQVHPDRLPERRRYVLIDDFCDSDSFGVEGVINFTADAKQYDYLALGARAQALGTAYFLPSPLLEPVNSGPAPEVHRVLVLLGSGDPHRLAALVLDALTQVASTLEVRVVGHYPATLQARHSAALFEAPTPQISKHYQWADFCITSGGLAKYECAWLGKPAAVISQTDGEHTETLQFERHGLCFNLGRWDEVSVTGLTGDLAALLADRNRRRAAHDHCRSQFNPDSARTAAEFVLDCLA